MTQMEKKQQRKETRKQRGTERRKRRQTKENYGFTMDVLIDADDVDKLRKAVRK